MKFRVVLAVVVLCQGKLNVDDDEVVFSLPDFGLNFRRFSTFSVCEISEVIEIVSMKMMMMMMMMMMMNCMKIYYTINCR